MSITSAQSLTPPPRTVGAPFPSRGRVRTGCLTCRARKIKCSEEKPVCLKCARAKRLCTWKASSANSGHGRLENREAVLEIPTSNSPENRTEQDLRVLSPQSAMRTICGHVLPVHPGTQSSFRSGPDAASSLRLPTGHSENTGLNHAETFLNSPSALALMTSQDIYLCTTIDRMAAAQTPSNPSFAYFLEEIQVPALSPFDSVNWKRIKVHITHLGAHDRAVAAAILAVQALYKAQANALPTAHAMSVYDAATSIFNAALQDEVSNFHNLLVTAFLLCLIEIIVPTDAGSVFRQQDGSFVRRLKAWLLGGLQSHGHRSVTALRIVAYLRILHAAARRGGGPGLLSPIVSGLLPELPVHLPSLPPPDGCADATTSIYDLLSAPIFDFYLESQGFSAQVAELSHYHRSRITSADQEEVDELLGHLKARMFDMWERRPSTTQLAAGDLRSHLSPAVAEPLTTLIGLCIAVFHTEIIEIGRTLSDPPLASSEAKQHMRHIREIVEGDWNAFSDGKLNPGYLRPLFLYAIESINVDHTQWAVERLKQINNPICRSDFFASFAKALAEAQRWKERRVTTKWLCYQTFGVPPPFL